MPVSIERFDGIADHSIDVFIRAIYPHNLGAGTDQPPDPTITYKFGTWLCRLLDAA
jgi:hypothetical protein